MNLYDILIHNLFLEEDIDSSVEKIRALISYCDFLKKQMTSLLGYNGNWGDEFLQVRIKEMDEIIEKISSKVINLSLIELFERGIDPKSSMNIGYGNPVEGIKKEMDAVINIIKSNYKITDGASINMVTALYKADAFDKVKKEMPSFVEEKIGKNPEYFWGLAYRDKVQKIDYMDI